MTTTIRLGIGFALIFFSKTASSQAIKLNTFFVNPSVYDTRSSPVTQILNAFGNYVNTKDSLYFKNPYWSDEEYKKRNVPDIFMKNIDYSFMFKQSRFYKPTVLSINKLDSGYVMKVLFANAEKDNGFSRISAIFNIGAVQENGIWKLHSMLDYNLRSEYKEQKIGAIHYYYHKSRTLNIELCNKFDTINSELAKKFNIPPLNVTYYLCKDNLEMQRLKGYDFEFTMAAPQQIGGMADNFNEVIYAGNNSEIYTHELTHLYIHKIYGLNVHEYFDEGLATLFGGSLGQPMEYHLHKIAAYVQKNKVDFTKLDQLDSPDEYTNFLYTIGGLLCKITLEKKGMVGIRELLICPKDNNAFFDNIYKVLDVKRENFNSFIYNQLQPYVH